MRDERDEHRRPIDFSPLGAPLDAKRFDALVSAAAAGAAAELERRRRGAGVARVVVTWRRPVLAMSALAAAAAIILLVRPTRRLTTAGSAGNAADDSGTIAEALGIPAAYAESVEGRWARAPQDTKEKP